MADIKLQAILTLKDKLSKPLKDNEKSFKKWSKAAVAAVGATTVAIGVKAVKAAIDYESAFAGVRKTVNASEEEFKRMEDAFINMSKQFPTSASDLARIGELAGQLGIRKENIVDFAKTISDLAVTTSLTAEDAAVSFARIINIMQISQDNVDNMGSSVVELGNNFATTEPEIINFATRIAGAGKVAGLNTADILGISTAFSSVGVAAERGGTAVSKTLFKMADEVARGGENLDAFAHIAGLTRDQFVTAFEKDAANAFNLFVAGLGERGIEATGLLEELELSDARLAQAFISVAGAGGIMTEAVNTSNVAFAENIALTEEAEKRYATTASQLEVLKNNFNAILVEVGEYFKPFLDDILKLLQGDLGRTFVDDLGDQLKLLFSPFTKVIGFLDDMSEKARSAITQSPISYFGKKIFGKQAGGYVSGGTPYVVGEGGPEMFVPSQSGNIIPNNKLGGGININFNNPTVRSDSDLEAIISEVKRVLNREQVISQLRI